MEIKIADGLKLCCEIPLLWVEKFQIKWEVNQHAFLELTGYIDRSIKYKVENLYESKIKLLLDKRNGSEVIFFGYLTTIVTENVGDTKKTQLKAHSGSFRLDQHIDSKSFQNVGMTYAEIVKQIADYSGGSVICSEGTDTVIRKPLIRYEETAWEFCKRLATHLGTCIIPDIVTGEFNFWFGMRKGGRVSNFSEEEYVIDIRKNNFGKTEISFEVESREFYKIGDKTVFDGQEMIICRVFAFFDRGELIFRYLLKDSVKKSIIYNNKFMGLGLTGTVLETRCEQVRVALDIDNGNSTGKFFYDWYPETGNALYTMPETGAHILLYFGSKDEREGFAAHCLPGTAKYKRKYQNRFIHTNEGNSAQLYKEDVSFSNSGRSSLSVGDDFVSVRDSGKITVSAQNAIKVNAKRVIISTPDELEICQG